MARRKGEVTIQQDLESQEDWDKMLDKEGLTVVDIYQEWAGPCVSMLSNFKKIKNQLTDDMLNFACAKADRIEALEKYRGKCEPCFLFIASGYLVNVIRGAKCPLLLKTIVQEMDQEHKVLNGETKRKVIVDEVVELQAQEESEIEEEKPKEVTVAIIKPDVVQEGKVDEIIQQMEEDGIEIIAQEEKQLTDEEAREFYSHLAEEDFFEDYITFMTSGISYVLILSKGETGEGIIEEWRNKLGPADVEAAKTTAPESLRAKYGLEGYMNALHGSDGPDSALRELAFFFPNFDVPTYHKKVEKLERTFALIRPDAYLLHKDEIIEKIKEAGFTIALRKEVQLTKEQAEEYYKEHIEQDYFEELTQEMSSGPLLALGLAREDAINKWREMLGPPDITDAQEEDPECLRAKFVVPGYGVNMLHGARTEEEAEEDFSKFFPVEQTLALIKPDAVGTKECIIEKIHEAGFRIASQKETMLTPADVETFYGKHKDDEYYDDLVNYMLSGPTMMMVLSREDAVQGWRSLIGPTDPEVAKEEDPESLRAQYGTDIMKNAVHGSSVDEKINEIISEYFTEEELAAGENADKTSEKPAEVTTEQIVQPPEETEKTATVAENEEPHKTESIDPVTEVAPDVESADNANAPKPIVEFPDSPEIVPAPAPTPEAAPAPAPEVAPAPAPAP